MPQVTIKLLPSQFKFVNSTAKAVLFSGAYGAGKSKALCYALAKQATIPNNVCLLVRKTLTSLKRSTLQSLIGGDDPVLPRGSYTYSTVDGTIKVNGGGIIYCLGIDDPVRIRSINAGCIAVDEGIEFTETEYLELLGRLRSVHGSRQIYIATNPSLPSHFLYKQFFLEKNKEREVVCAKTSENIYLPQDYVNNLKELPPVLYRRYVMGEWCATERAIFDNFDRGIHVRRIHEGLSFEEYFIGLDFGYTHPTAILLIGRSGDRVHVVKEWRKSKQLMGDIVKVVESFARGLPMQPKVVIDPSAATMVAQLQSEGFDAVGANNDVLGGINRIRQKLVVRNDSPDLVISDTCPMLVEEMESYQFEPEKEKPIMIGEDLVCALRYTVNQIDDIATGRTKPFVLDYDKEDDEDEMLERELHTPEKIII